jgi:hypothetical protein
VSLYGIEGTICYFKDIYDLNCKNNNTFIRVIGDIELYYYNGECYILNKINLFNNKYI